MDNCVVPTIYEYIALLPRKVPQYSIDPMARIGNEDKLVSLGSYELGETLAHVDKEWFICQADEFVWIAFNKGCQFICCLSNWVRQRPIRP